MHAQVTTTFFTKKHSIVQYPEILAVHLVRWVGQGQVLAHPVHPDDVVNFSGEVYSLCSVLVHSGEYAHSGHYYAFVKHQSGAGESKWWLYDDLVRREAHTSELRHFSQVWSPGKVYMTFYERCSERAGEPPALSTRSVVGAGNVCDLDDSAAHHTVGTPTIAADVGRCAPYDESTQHLDVPPGQPQQQRVVPHLWSVVEAVAWLQEQGFDGLAEQALSEHIDGAALLELTDHELECYLGVFDWDDRSRIISLIANLPGMKVDGEVADVLPQGHACVSEPYVPAAPSARNMPYHRQSGSHAFLALG